MSAQTKQLIIFYIKGREVFILPLDDTIKPSSLVILQNGLAYQHEVEEFEVYQTLVTIPHNFEEMLVLVSIVVRFGRKETWN